MTLFEKIFGTKAGNAKIDSQLQQVLELEATKKRLEMERDQIALELQNQKKRSAMALEEESHKQKLDFAEKKAVFDREKAVWATEKAEITARAERDRKEFEARLKADSEMKLTEAVTLAKLDSQQQVKQAELDRDRKISELRTEHAEALAKVKADTAEEYYKKMSAAFSEIQIHGDKASKFQQELALKMIEAMPRARTDLGVSISDGRAALPAPATVDV